MSKFLIFKAGSTYSHIKLMAGDTHEWIIKAVNRPELCFETVELDKQPDAINFKAYSGIFITGSHSNVTEKQTWMLHAHQLIKQGMAAGIPILGICFGHQLLADALGGMVDYCPRGGESGIVEVWLKNGTNPLTKNLPRQFKAFAAHEQTVITMPDGAICHGTNLQEHHHIVEFAPKTWGVQYHPEFTPHISNAYFDMEQKPGNRGSINDYTLAQSTGKTLLSNFIGFALGH
jgi:GMP synthase (glutamine-hydrolysing)